MGSTVSGCWAVFYGAVVSLVPCPREVRVGSKPEVKEAAIVMLKESEAVFPSHRKYGRLLTSGGHAVMTEAGER